MRHWIVSIITVLLICSSTFSFATGTQKELNVAYYNNDPLSFEEDGQPRGYYIDLLNEIAKKENWQLNYYFYDFGEGLNAVEAQAVDLMLGVAHSESRDKRFEYSQASTFVDWAQIYTNKFVQVDTFQDLEGLKIGVIKSDIFYIGSQGIKRTLLQFGIQAEFVEYGDKHDLFKDLEAGKVDVSAISRTFALEYSNDFDIKKTSLQFSPVNMFVITPKGSGTETLTTIDSYIYEWKADKNSYLYSRMNKWFESSASEHVPLWLWATMVGIIGLLGVAGVVIIVTQKIISKQTFELKSLNSSLEDKVRDRTIDLDATNQQLRVSLISLEEKQSELEEMNAILEEQVDLIERTKDQLVASEKMASLGRMVSSLAHELNTPVGICVTLQSNIKKNTSDIRRALEGCKLTKKELVEYIDDMEATSDMFKNNITTVVDLVDRFKMLSSDRVVMNERKVNLHTYLHMQMDALSPELKVSRHKYAINCPRDLECVVDPSALSQVIRNLTMNALIHGFEEKEQGQIDIDVSRRNEHVCIEFMDDGNGMAKDVQSKMFEPFFTTKRNKGGTGLGLSIVHSAVTQSLNGEIRVDERYKDGVKYEIELPFIEEEPFKIVSEK